MQFCIVFLNAKLFFVCSKNKFHFNLSLPARIFETNHWERVTLNMLVLVLPEALLCSEAASQAAAGYVARHEKHQV